MDNSQLVSVLMNISKSLMKISNEITLIRTAMVNDYKLKINESKKRNTTDRTIVNETTQVNNIRNQYKPFNDDDVLDRIRAIRQGL